MLRLNDPDNTSRTLAGLALVTAPVLLLASQVLRLTIEPDAPGEAELMAAVAANDGLWQVMTIVDMVHVILFVPAVLGMIHLSRGRSPVLAHIGGALAMIGILGAAGHNVFANVLNGAMARVNGAGAEMEALVVQFERTPGFAFVLLMFIVGFFLGVLLLAVALYRSRSVPRLAAAAIGLGMVLGSNAGASLPLTLVACGLLTLGMGTVGYRVLSMTDDRWARKLRPEPDAAFAAGTPSAPIA